jgi:nicotinate phosphoribosyltransferase
MIQAFIALGGSELDAFRAYAESYPEDCLLLVDTIDTLDSGVPNAIIVFEELKRKGYEPVGVRLDSGDLAYLSIRVARMLNEAGFPDTVIVLSNDLDELVIWQIITQIQEEAPRNGIDPDHLIGRLVYGVGTRLITSGSQPALDGVYKLVAVERNGGWVPAIKVSETPTKTLNPGHKRAWRVYDMSGKATADLLSLDTENPRQMEHILLHHPTEHTKYRSLRKQEISEIEPLMVTVFCEGEMVYELPSIEDMRKQRIADVDRLHSGVRRLMNPHTYHVSLTRKLWDLKQNLISAALGRQPVLDPRRSAS